MANWNEVHKTITVIEPHRKVVEFTEKYLTPGMRILDLGCGKGRHSLYCAKKGYEVHAVDVSETGLDDLRSEIECDQLFELVKVTQSNISKLPFPNSYFDAIICINVLQHGLMSDIKNYFSEAQRVLKSGGLFLFAVTGMDFIKQYAGDETKELEPGTFVGLKTVPDGDIPHHAFTEEEIYKLLDKSKIINIEIFEQKSQWLKSGDPIKHIIVTAKKK